MCVHSHPEALTCPTGELNTSPVNEVMLNCVGARQLRPSVKQLGSRQAAVVYRAHFSSHVWVFLKHF